MQRVIFFMPFMALLALAPAMPVAAQAGSAPAHIYEAYYRVSPADLPEWNRQFLKYSKPILDDLRERGAIEGWSHWLHQTGGEYNVRFTARTYDWASINTFWSEYLDRLNGAMPQDNGDVSRLIQAHRDEIWDVVRVQVPESYEPTYMYASTYRYNFADGAEWHRIWDEVAAPVVQEAMSDGLLGGWVILSHNTGGSHNFKVLYLFDEWDHIDNFFERVIGTISEQHESDWTRVQKLTDAHDDAIWVPLRQGGM